MNDAAEGVHQNFMARTARGDFPAAVRQGPARDTSLTSEQLVEIFASQMLSRHLDFRSRKLQAAGEGFYTIGSSGHEGNAAIAAAFRPTDTAFLHYRDAAFMIQRSKQVPGETIVYDMLLSFVASSDDPISGGRHKVLGSKSLSIPPQTSTIASHLPKAVGAAFSIGLSKRLKVETEWPKDSVIACSFGDASLNHSTAQGAINTAGWTAYQGIHLPLVFICEDNGIGISTRTPPSWVAASMRARAGLTYLHCSGLDMIEAYETAKEAVTIARQRKKPVFLHTGCVRLFGHAGSDAQLVYLSKDEIAAQESNDPLLHSARTLVERGILRGDEILDLYNDIERRCERVANEVIKRPKLTTRAAIRASLVPPKRARRASNGPSAQERERAFGRELEAMDKPQHMAKLINWALTDLMLDYPEVVIAGEDVGPKGGVYNVTSKLHERFGGSRVINTLLDEQSILGLAIGLGQNGFVPIPEIQFLAYLHNAEDQLRGEASTLSFFSNGQFTNPMVIRIAGLGYQKGFGGHFHNDNSLAVLRDIPGIIVAVPSNGADAVGMLRECVRLAREEQRVVVFVEPIALYMTRDLHEVKDGLWTFDYPQAGSGAIALGEIGVSGKGRDLAILTYGNGFYLSCQARKALEEIHGIKLRIIDLRWLAPLNEAAILDAVKGCGAVLVVDECRATGSQSEGLMTLLLERGEPGVKLARVVADDSFIPLGRAATVPLPSREDIIEAALTLVGKKAAKAVKG